MKTKIIIPINSPQELEDLQYILSETIHLLSDPEQSEQQESIYWLSRILIFTFTKEQE